MSGNACLVPEVSASFLRENSLTMLEGATRLVTSGPSRRVAGARTGSDTVKRAIDCIVALLLLGFALPLIAVAAALIVCDGGPAFFAHTRFGRHGRPFRCWKLRTMAPDALERLPALLAADPALAAEWARSFKLRNDPRVTGVGRLLRRTRLDELPQLWNVLAGDMSLVGPRPVTRAELTAYGRWARLYCSVRPGLTGLWQVSGDAETTYAERIAMDRDYVENRSLVRDLMILLRTGPVVLRRTGC